MPAQTARKAETVRALRAVLAQTGKSTLVRRAFPDATICDLLEADTFRELDSPASFCSRPC